LHRTITIQIAIFLWRAAEKLLSFELFVCARVQLSIYHSSFGRWTRCKIVGSGQTRANFGRTERRWRLTTNEPFKLRPRKTDSRMMTVCWQCELTEVASRVLYTGAPDYSRSYARGLMDLSTPAPVPATQLYPPTNCTHSDVQDPAENRCAAQQHETRLPLQCWNSG